MKREKRKWSDVKDEVLGTKKEKEEEPDEETTVPEKAKRKPQKAAPRVSAKRPVNARPLLGRQSPSKVWNYSD